MQPGGLLGSLNFALDVGGFVRGRWIHSGVPWGLLGSFVCTLGVVVFIQGRWGREGAQWRSLGSFRVVQACHAGRLGSLGTVRFVRVRSRCSWVHMGSVGSFGYNLGIVWFIRDCRIHLGAPWRSLCLFLDDVSIRVCPGGRWVHLWWLGSLVCALGVVGFIRDS